MAAGAHSTSEGPAAERPLLAPWLRRTRSRDGRLVLEYGDEIVVLGGERALALLDGVLPLLDGTRTAAAVAAELGSSEPIVESIVDELRASGLVVSGPAAGETALLCAGLAHDSHPREIERHLETATVAVVGESTCAEELIRLLEPGVGEVERIGWDALPDADVTAVAPAPSELPRLELWNERLLEHGLPWLQLLPFNGRFAALGPLFVPGETCCEHCYRLRRGGALGEPELLAELDRVPATYPQPQPLAAAMAGLAATLLTRWIATREAALPGVLFALELGDGLRIDSHRVLRVPRCPACSQASAVAAPLPWSNA